MKPITARKVLITSFLVDLLDVVLNLVIAVLTGSVVMIAEALQGGADLLAAGFLIIGLARSNAPPDKLHPFGHGRELYFWTLLSSLVMLTITASFSFYLGLQRFLEPEKIENLYLAYLVLMIAILTNGYALSLSFKRLTKGHSPYSILSRFFRTSYIETKTAFILDLMGSSSAFLGLVALIIYGLTGNLRFDGIGAMLIGTSLAGLSFLLLLNIKEFLIGKSASSKTESKIRRAALKTPEVKEVLDLKTLHIGPEKLLINMEVHLEDDLTTDQIEKLIDKIKSQVQKEVPQVHHIQVELETPN